MMRSSLLNHHLTSIDNIQSLRRLSHLTPLEVVECLRTLNLEPLFLNLLEYIELLLVLRLLQLFLVVIELQGVDEFGNAVDEHAPAQDEHRRVERRHGLQHDLEASQQDEGGHDPEPQADATVATAGDEGDVLVEGAQDEHDADDVHQG